MTKTNEFMGKVTMKMLRYFYELSQMRHFGRAASRLNITNSPLSSQIKELEGHLGVELVQRDSRNVNLTEAGKVLQAECEHLFRSFEHSMFKVQCADRKHSKQIQLGTVSSAFWAGLGSMMKRFNQQNPDYCVDLVEMSPKAQKQAILAKNIDIGIVRFADTLDINPLMSRKLTDEQFVVAMSREHVLAQKSQLSLQDLRQFSFTFLRRKNSASASLIINECNKAGFVPNLGKEFIEPTTLMAYIPVSDAIAIVPVSFSAHQWEDVCFIPLKENISACLYAVFDSDSLTEPAQEFLNELTLYQSV